MLSANGQPQRLVAKVPAYALSARNEIRVSFLRQPRPYCHDPATGYPVSILPSSHLTLAKRSLGNDFVGASSQLSRGNQVFVPGAWLQDAPASLGKVIAVASAVGASPEASELKVVDAGAAVSPGAPWLAFAVAPAGVDVAGLKDGHLRSVARRSRCWMSAAWIAPPWCRWAPPAASWACCTATWAHRHRRSAHRSGC